MPTPVTWTWWPASWQSSWRTQFSAWTKADKGHAPTLSGSPAPLPTCGCSLCPWCCSWLCETVGTCSAKEKCRAGSGGRWKLMGGITWCPADLICFQQWQPAWKLQTVKPNFVCQSEQATALFCVSSLVAPKLKGATSARSLALLPL